MGFTSLRRIHLRPCRADSHRGSPIRRNEDRRRDGPGAALRRAGVPTSRRLAGAIGRRRRLIFPGTHPGRLRGTRLDLQDRRPGEKRQPRAASLSTLRLMTWMLTLVANSSPPWGTGGNTFAGHPNEPSLRPAGARGNSPPDSRVFSWAMVEGGGPRPGSRGRLAIPVAGSLRPPR